MMKKRLLWTIIFSTLFIVALVPVNRFLSSDIHTLEQASYRNFISIVLVESILIFGVVFQIVNEYFRENGRQASGLNESEDMGK